MIRQEKGIEVGMNTKMCKNASCMLCSTLFLMAFLNFVFGTFAFPTAICILSCLLYATSAYLPLTEGEWFYKLYRGYWNARGQRIIADDLNAILNLV